MKSIVNVCRVLFFVIISLPFIIYGQNSQVPDSGADRILGEWITQKKDSKVKIVKDQDGSYSGKLVWVASPNESFTGETILKDVKYDPATDTYECPWVYDPKLDMAARATAHVSNDTLYLKARKGVITKNEFFTRPVVRP